MGRYHGNSVSSPTGTILDTGRDFFGSSHNIDIPSFMAELEIVDIVRIDRSSMDFVAGPGVHWSTCCYRRGDEY